MSLLSLSKATTVYIAYDQAGRVIYVGITGQGPGRNEQHQRKSEWWPFHDRQEVEHYPDREAAAAREMELIHSHLPPFNKQGNPQWQKLRAGYLALVQAERDYQMIRNGRAEDLKCEPCYGLRSDETCQFGSTMMRNTKTPTFDWCGNEDCRNCHGRWHGWTEALPEGHEIGYRTGYANASGITVYPECIPECRDAACGFLTDEHFKRCGENTCFTCHARFDAHQRGIKVGEMARQFTHAVWLNTLLQEDPEDIPGLTVDRNLIHEFSRRRGDVNHCINEFVAVAEQAIGVNAAGFLRECFALPRSREEVA